MIAIPGNVRVWLATGYTDMRRGFPSLALQMQEVLHKHPLSGHLFVFRGRRSGLVKAIWHDGQGACLFTKRLERGKFIRRSAGESVTISPAQLSYLLSGIDWRAPQETHRPTRSDSRFYGLNLLLDLNQWLHDIEAGRSSIGSFKCLQGAAGRA
ncbi:IS66 family insertion sequence element accessory protein TnpB [Bradyrhizobium sp. IC4061]|uniref:IS66 family insertion sequence element accessory protein TnpB n=1 Tax=unclassified Bradyrhizobium TaxID=2631580 RepID=UPI002A2720E1|nr:IS66 family insertion sequence element accessory protein TnpB [Bradyrhizobium sp. IC4060]MCA1489127.1 IS66 family insertion sequence element accessory protein TnpB [Bradyrhizobium sp. IC4061]